MTIFGAQGLPNGVHFGTFLVTVWAKGGKVPNALPLQREPCFQGFRGSSWDLFLQLFPGPFLGRPLEGHLAIFWSILVSKWCPKGTSLVPFGRTFFEHFLARIQATD